MFFAASMAQRGVNYMDRKFQISVRSNFAELWRYNIVVMCGAYNAAGEQLAVTTSESTVATVGEELTAATIPDAAARVVKLQPAPCDNIKTYIYLMPHKLPTAGSPDDTPTFGIRVKVKADGEELYNVIHQVNQWSGATIELRLPKAE